MAYNHGVGVSESPTKAVVPLSGTSGLQVIFGTAPVFKTKAPEANKLVCAYSFEEAVEALGWSEDWQSYSLCQAMFASFKMFNISPVIFCNVLDVTKAAHKESLTSADYPVTEKQAVVNVAGVIVDSSLSVKNGETDLVKDTDFVVSYDDSDYMVITLLDTTATASCTEVTVSGNKVKPSGVTASDVAGGVDSSTGKLTGIELVKEVYPRFGLVPGTLLAPGWSDNLTVAAALSAKTENINGKWKAMALIDLDTTTVRKYSDVKEYKDTSGLSSKFDILLWPCVKNIPGKVMAYSAVMGACLAYADANNDDVASLSPSNRLIGVGGACLKDGTEIYLDELQANVLNGAGVVTLINDSGWRTWGNNTAVYPGSTDPKDRWINCRRFFNYFENTFILNAKGSVDSLASYVAIQAIVDSENIRGNSLAAQGKCAGVSVSFRPEDNPITQILDGTIKFKTLLAPYPPMEYIANDFEFDPSILEAALNM